MAAAEAAYASPTDALLLAPGVPSARPPPWGVADALAPLLYEWVAAELRGLNEWVERLLHTEEWRPLGRSNGCCRWDLSIRGMRGTQDNCAAREALLKTLVEACSTQRSALLKTIANSEQHLAWGSAVVLGCGSLLDTGRWKLCCGETELCSCWHSMVTDAACLLQKGLLFI
jgi:hypothetical protein